jgi:glycosyltransferase involved in cell wall biosynthesis
LKEKLVSIIVPVYNSENLIDEFFKVFQSASINNNIDLNIVDNGSTDHTYEKLKQYIDVLPQLNVYVYNEKQSSYAARNYGVSVSKGDILAFVDFDCKVTDKYLQNIIRFTQSHKPGEIVAGAVDLYYVDKNIYEIFDKVANLKQESRVKRNSVLTANLIVYRQDYEAIGGFDEVVSGGDHAFSQKAVSKGFSVVYDGAYLVKHPPRATYREHMIKAQRVGKGLSQVFADSSASFSSKLIFTFKKLLTLFFPLHQLSLVVKIVKENKLSGKDVLMLIKVAYAVGFNSRLASIKQILVNKT